MVRAYTTSFDDLDSSATTLQVDAPTSELLLNVTSLSSSSEGQVSSDNIAVAVGETLTFVGVVYVPQGTTNLTVSVLLPHEYVTVEVESVHILDYGSSIVYAGAVLNDLVAAHIQKSDTDLVLSFGQLTNKQDSV